MATRKQKVKVGAFLFLCFACLVIGVSYVAGMYEKEGTPYWIEFDESILGLGSGSQVFYLGVPVGKVTDIFVTSTTKRAHVEFTIDPEKVQLQRGTKGSLRIYSLAAGTMAISLSGGDPSAEVLPPNSQIPSEPSIFAISGEIEGLMENLSSIAESIDVGLEGIESGELAQLVSEGRSFLGETSDLVNETRDTVVSLRTSAENVLTQFADLSEEIKSLSQETKALVATTSSKIDALDVAGTEERLQRVLDNMGDLSERMNGVLARVDSMSDEVTHNVDDVEYTLRRSLEELSDTFDSVKIFVNELREDPSSAIWGRGKTKEIE